MRYTIFILFVLLKSAISFAQENYDVGAIPTKLLSRANAVVRNDETVVDMQSPNEVNLTVDKAITILNKNGDERSRLVLFYDKNTIIKSVKGEVYNEFGKLVGKFSQGDFRDESAVQGFSLFEDSRLKHYLPSVNTYPFTIVYHYEIKFKQNLIIPDWTPKTGEDVSVEKSSYTFICKPEDQFRVKTQNYVGKTEEAQDSKRKSLIWRVSNLASVKTEPYSPPIDTYLTSVKIAPENFSYFNYKGSYRNWEELGKWTYDKLLTGRSVVPSATAAYIKDLVKHENTEKGKAKKIYEFLQNKTRYISVQIGIGGFQPVTAADVDRLGYGDCKALVNYMQSLLSVVNIESYYCVVEAGRKKTNLDPTYASMNQGNHVILCLPLKGDTTWLECTSQTLPFGFLGDFTDDRYVLACTANGGKLLRTPKFNPEQNLQIRDARLTLTNDGNISGSVHTVFKGTQYDQHEIMLGKPVAEQQRMLKGIYDIDNIYFDQISYQQTKSEKPELIENLTIHIRNYGSVNNDRLFLSVNAFNIQPTIPEVRNRLMPVYINRGYMDIDTIIYHLPNTFLPLTETQNKNFRNEFGEYESKIRIEAQQLIFTRRLLLNEGTFPPESYHKFFQFMADVNAADHYKIVFSLTK